MTYPINPDEYIAAVRAAGISLPERGERYFREVVIPLVNDSYRDGLEGSDAFPMDPDKTIEEFAQGLDHTLSTRSRDMMRLLTEWCNEAAATGQREAKEARG